MKRLFIITLLSIGLIACSSANKQVKVEPLSTAGPTMVSQKTGKDTKVDKADIDGDGKPDVFTYYKKDPNTGTYYKVKLEADLNSDGKLDLWRTFDKLGRRIEDKYDLDFDGKVDEVVKYKKSRPSVVMLATHFDGKFDVKEFYAMVPDPATNQKHYELVLIKISTKRNGVFDEFHYFVNGHLVRIGWDKDGDGRPEVFEDNPSAGGE